MKRTATIAAVFSILFLAGSIFAQDSFNLTFKLEKGKTYFYRTNSTVETTQNMMGTEMTINVLSKSKLKLEVTDATPTQTEIVTSFDSLYSKTSGMQGDQENNGEGVVGKKTKYVYDNYGKKLKKIEVDAIPSQGMGDLGGSSNLFYQLTEKPMKVGETWSVSRTDTTKTGEDGKMITKSDIDCKVDGKETYKGAACLKISVTGKIKIEGAMVQQGFNIVLEGSGKTGGYFYYDIAKGLMLFTDTNTDVDLTAAIPDQSITIPITTKTKAKVELTEK